MSCCPKVHLTALSEHDSLSSDENQKFQRLDLLYAQHLQGIFPLPNHTESAVFPRGVAVKFGKNAPMFTAPFHPDEFMTFGTTLVQVRGPVPPVETLRNPTRQYKASLLRAIQSTESALSLQRRDVASNKDERGFNYAGAIGVNTNHAMAGLMRGTAVMNNERVSSYFIWVSAGLPALSRDLLKKVADRQTYAAPATSKELNVSVFTGPRRVSTTLTMEEFLSWDETNYAVRAGTRNRLAIATEVARVLGLTVDTQLDLAAGTPNRRIAVPFADTPSYELQVNSDGGFTYFSDAVNTERVLGAFCMQYSPLVGGALLFGVPNASHRLGAGWVNQCANAFPASTGRMLDATNGYKRASQHDSTRFSLSDPGTHAFCWHGALPYNDKTHPATFRERNHVFKQCERVLGRDPSISEMDLSPVLMILDQTPEHKAGLA
jgi:hypothetical protein